MAKKIDGYIKMQIVGGSANPAPPVGPALGQHGINIMEFCKAFNAKTQEMQGKIIPVVIRYMLTVLLHLSLKHLQPPFYY